MENILFVLLHIGITLLLASFLIKRAWNRNISAFKAFPRSTSKALEINDIQQTMQRFRAIYVLGLWKSRGPKNKTKRFYSETKIGILFSILTTLGALQSILLTQISQDSESANINGFLYIPLISLGWCYFLAAILAIILDCYQARFDKLKSIFKGIEFFEPLDPRPKIAFHIGNVVANLIVFGYTYGTTSEISVPDFYKYLFGSFGVQLGIELVISLFIAILGLNGLTRLAVWRTHIDKEIEEIFNQEQEIENFKTMN